MCRNIKPLFNFDPPATREEVQNASLQYVRKLSGFQKPSQINEEAFTKAVEEISIVTQRLFTSLITNSSPRNREEEAEKARIKNVKRFGETH